VKTFLSRHVQESSAKGVLYISPRVNTTNWPTWQSPTT